MPIAHSNDAPATSDAPIPVQSGLGLACVILGAVCIPLSVYVGMHSFAIELPAFGVWYLLPIVILTIILGMLASRTAQGIAGATLGVVALLICMAFILADRLYGPDIRAQSRTAPPAAQVDPMKLQQL